MVYTTSASDLAEKQIQRALSFSCTKDTKTKGMGLFFFQMSSLLCKSLYSAVCITEKKIQEVVNRIMLSASV